MVIRGMVYYCYTNISKICYCKGMEGESSQHVLISSDLGLMKYFLIGTDLRYAHLSRIFFLQLHMGDFTSQSWRV